LPDVRLSLYHGKRIALFVYDLFQRYHEPMNQDAPILIVDDQPSFRIMLTVLLEDAGYSVASAANGRDALAYLHQATKQPGLILLDLAMPVMNGWDFLHIQQQEARLAAIPVVLVTAREDRWDEQDTTPAVAYLTKPLDLLALLTTIEYSYSSSLTAEMV
jgi:CheY-like chemotaxis protein